MSSVDILGRAFMRPKGTGTVEGVTRFATPTGEYVRRATTASEFEQVDLFEVLEDGTEVWVGGYAVDLAELHARRAAERRASFRLIEGGGATQLPPPPAAPALPVRPFGEAA